MQAGWPLLYAFCTKLSTNIIRQSDLTRVDTGGVLCVDLVFLGPAASSIAPFAFSDKDLKIIRIQIRV